MKKNRKFNFLILAVASVFIGCGNGNSHASSEDQGNNAVNNEIMAADAVGEGDPYKNPNFKIVDNLIISENLPIVIDFYADWCGPCKQFSPIFHEVASEYAGQACFVSINTDDYPDLANRYQVSSIPTTVYILPGGGVLGKQVGGLNKEAFTTFVNQLIETAAGDDMAI